MQVTLTPEEIKLYNDCIEIYGLDNQLEQYMEECIEAALAVRKYFRAKKSGDQEKITESMANLRSEIVDTTNMSIQMKISLMNPETFNHVWNHKITRQIGRVKNKTQEGDGK
jgi:hypothetical protein